MNARQLAKLGISKDCVPQAIQAVQAVAKHNRSIPKDQRIDVEQAIRDCAANPRSFLEGGGVDGTPEHTTFLARYGTFFTELAEALIDNQEPVHVEPIPYRTWGEEIDPAAHHQMKTACSLPVACGAALMPDAHVGYGLPIGGVLALENAVAPYAVGVDIACRMRAERLRHPPRPLGEAEAVVDRRLGTGYGLRRWQRTREAPGPSGP